MCIFTTEPVAFAGVGTGGRCASGQGRKVSAGAGIAQAHEGFSWQVLEEIKGAFLILDGWHFVSEQNEGTQSYFITLEDLTRSGSFLPAFP